MTEQAGQALSILQTELLDLGLEDVIPLGEPYYSSKDPKSPLFGSFEQYREALLELLDLGLIEVWSGPWETEPEPMDPAEGRRALSNESQYTFSTPADLLNRVYFINEENLR